jgi:hypothetical protein
MAALRSPYPPNSAFVKKLYDFLSSPESYEYERFLADSGGMPSVTQLSSLLNTAFWASLETEEGQRARVAIAVTTPDEAIHHLVFTHPLTYSAEVLVKLSPILGNVDTCLAISIGKREAALRIWGICSDPRSGLALRCPAPGHVFIYAAGEIVADLPPGKPPRIMTPSLWILEIQDFLRDTGLTEAEQYKIAWHLRFLAKAMQHGRGGAVLLVPETDKRWEQSLDIKYRIRVDELNFLKRADKWNKDSEEFTGRLRKRFGGPPEGIIIRSIGTFAERSFKQVAHMIGRLTAVDGATVLGRSFTLIGFGAKIRSKASMSAEMIEMLDPADRVSEFLSLDDVGGMRHRSAVQFVHDNPEALALVASQDGRLTLFLTNQYKKVRGLKCASLLW